MVIGIDASQANRQLRSGTEWYAFYLIQELKKLLGAEHPPNFTILLYVKNALQDDLAKDLPVNFAVKVLRWPFRYFWGQLRLSLEMLANRPDVLFCPAHTIPLIHPKKTVTTLHDVGFEDYPELYDWKTRLYHKFSARLGVRRAWRILTVSNFSRERIIENYSCNPDKIRVTHLGTWDPFLVSKEFSRVQTRFRPDLGKYILYLGRLEPKKNILNIVKAYEMASVEPNLVLAGKKVNIKEVDAYLKVRPELAKKIVFTGYVEEAEKPRLYRDAKLFLFPTLYEGFGLPILEAQACGTPVVTSNTGSNPEIAGEGAVIVDPESPYEIAEAIKKVLIDESLRSRIRLEGLQNAKKFSWKETAFNTLQAILENVLDSR